MAGYAGTYGVDYSHARPTREMLTRDRTVAGIGIGGMTFACRYVLDDARNRGKALSRTEALELSSWGLGVVANFEYAIAPTLTAEQGRADARVALAELEEIGAPRRVVYFSFDYDVPVSHYAGVLNYLTGAASVIGAENVGAYGHYGLCQYLGARSVRWLWQTYAWSRGLWSNYATVRQIRNGAFPGEFDGDLNIAMAEDIGAWRVGVSEESRDDMDKSETSNCPDNLKAAYVALGLPVPTANPVERLWWLADLRGNEAKSLAGAARREATLAANNAADAKTMATEARDLAAQTYALVSSAAGGTGEDRVVIDYDVLASKVAAILSPAIASELARRLES